MRQDVKGVNKQNSDTCLYAYKHLLGCCEYILQETKWKEETSESKATEDIHCDVSPSCVPLPRKCPTIN